MPIVKMPTGELVDMPDNPTPKQLAELELLHSSSGLQAPAEPSGFDTFKRRAGVLARGAATGVTGTVGMLGDALNTGINMAAGTSLGMPSKAIQGALSGMGLPEAQTGDEKFMEALASFGGGMMDPAMTGITRQIAQHFGGLYPNTAAPNQVRADTIRRAQEEGYKFSPSEAGAGMPGRALQTMTGGRLHDEVANYANQGVTDQIARRQLGLPRDTPLTEQVMRQMMDDTYQNAYGPVRGVGQIPSMPGFRQAMQDISNNHGIAASFPDARQPDITALVNAYNVPQFDSSHAVDAIRGLRQAAKDAHRTGRGDLGEAQRQIATALENNIEEYLTAQQQQGILHGVVRNNRLTAINPQQLIDDFRQGRQALAMQHAVDDSLVEGAGNVDATKLAQQMNKGVPLTDGLRTIAETANVARPSMHYPQGGKPNMFSQLERYLAAGAVMGTPYNPVSLAGLAAPLASSGIRQGMMTDMGQRLFAQPATPTGPIDPAMLRGLIGLGSGLYSGE